MKTKNILRDSALLIFSLLLAAGSALGAPNDPSGGLCDNLDPSSGLFSTCIQAHSAKNRIEHLQSKNASANAVLKAHAALDASIAQYALLGGGVIPGFAPPPQTCPCWTAAQLETLAEQTLSCGAATAIGDSLGFGISGWDIAATPPFVFVEDYEQAYIPRPAFTPSCALHVAGTQDFIVNPITVEQWDACKVAILAECSARGF